MTSNGNVTQRVDRVGGQAYLTGFPAVRCRWALGAFQAGTRTTEYTFENYNRKTEKVKVSNNPDPVVSRIYNYAIPEKY